MLLPLKIATRFIKTNKAQTTLIVLGIAIGISVQIFIGLLIQGLQKDLINTTIGSTPHIFISSQSDSRIKNWQGIIDQIKTNYQGGVKEVTAAVELPAFIDNNGLTEGILVKGFSLSQADEIYKISPRLEGRLPEEKNQIIIGEDLAVQLGISIGDKVKLNSFSGEGIAVEITGIFDFKIAAINKSWILTNLTTAQQFFGLGNEITSIQISLVNVFEADSISLKLSQDLNRDDMLVENWKDQNQQLLSGLQGQSVSSLIIQIFVMLAVLLSIASVLAITVMQKSKQIGILKAMGIKDKGASLIFMSQGLILGTMGAFAGVILGLLLIFAFTAFAVNPDGTPVVNVYLNYSFIFLSMVIAIIASGLASLLPARKSSRLNPIEVIKNG